jgi:uncharacterized protein YceH (UPF0502 family)
MLESAVVGCFFEFQVTTPPASMERYPVTERRSSGELAQSASEKKSIAEC